jgi:hypothetical protein
MTENETVIGRRSAQAAADITVYPALRAGYGRPGASCAELWIQVAWLMLAEGRAYAEDLAASDAEPAMSQVAKLRLLEQLTDIDSRLAGRVPAADPHCLALALEYGLHELMDASGDDLAAVFALTEEFGGDRSTTAGVFTLWKRLLDRFPGELPDRLVAQGQRDLLVTVRRWGQLAESVGLDIGLLAPFMKDI